MVAVASKSFVAWHRSPSSRLQAPGIPSPARLGVEKHALGMRLSAADLAGEKHALVMRLSAADLAGEKHALVMRLSAGDPGG